MQLEPISEPHEWTYLRNTKLGNYSSTYLEVVVRVYWTLVQYGGEGGEERGSGVEGGNPRHSTLITRHSLYFGGSCVPTMTVRTVLPSGSWLYLIKTNLFSFV